MNTAFTAVKVSTPAPLIACLTLHRPDAANALNRTMAEEIASFFNTLPKDTRCVVLTGSGPKAFCAGADLKERIGLDEVAWEAQHATYRAARDAVLACPIPTIAAVNGAAFGGGLELALACDFIYASENARFALPEATLGIMPGMGGTQTLPRRIGHARAAEMLYTGQSITAYTGMEWGLVNHVFPQEILLEKTLETVSTIVAAAPVSLRAIKSAMSESFDFNKEMQFYRPLLLTQDRLEGIAAFNEKRKPVFSGH